MFEDDLGEFKMRVGLLAVMPTIAIAGCSAGALTPQAVAMTQIDCSLQQGSGRLVLVLDTTKGKATLVNVTGAPTGTLTATPFEYRVAFPAQGSLLATEAVINRYDGEMLREFGKPPFDVRSPTPRSGNASQTWRCRRMSVGPAI